MFDLNYDHVENEHPVDRIYVITDEKWKYDRLLAIAKHLEGLRNNPITDFLVGYGLDAKSYLNAVYGMRIDDTVDTVDTDCPKLLKPTITDTDIDQAIQKLEALRSKLK